MANESKVLAHYQKLALGVPTKLLKSVANFFQKNKNASLESLRNKAFKALYTAVRSRLITSAYMANGFFTALCEYEEEYRVYLDKPESDTFNLLVKKYEEITEKTASLEQVAMPLLKEERIHLSHFRPFFELLQKTGVTQDEFSLAPVLLVAETGDLSGNDVLLELRNRLWPHRAS